MRPLIHWPVSGKQRWSDGAWRGRRHDLYQCAIFDLERSGHAHRWRRRHGCACGPIGIVHDELSRVVWINRGALRCDPVSEKDRVRSQVAVHGIERRCGIVEDATAAALLRQEEPRVHPPIAIQIQAHGVTEVAGHLLGGRSRRCRLFCRPIDKRDRLPLDQIGCILRVFAHGCLVRRCCSRRLDQYSCRHGQRRGGWRAGG